MIQRTSCVGDGGPTRPHHGASSLNQFREEVKTHNLIKLHTSTISKTLYFLNKVLRNERFRQVVGSCECDLDTILLDDITDPLGKKLNIRVNLPIDIIKHLREDLVDFFFKQKSVCFTHLISCTIYMSYK